MGLRERSPPDALSAGRKRLRSHRGCHDIVPRLDVAPDNLRDFGVRMVRDSQRDLDRLNASVAEQLPDDGSLGAYFSPCARFCSGSFVRLLLDVDRVFGV